MRNPYTRNRQMARLFDAMLEAAKDGGSELYLRRRDGGLARRTGGLHRCAFWAGVDVERKTLRDRPVWVMPGTLGSACYRAGREAAKAGIIVREVQR